VSAAAEFDLTSTAVVGRTFRGFGTTVGVWTTAAGLLPRLEQDLRDWVQTVERAASRFDSDSDISRANERAGTPVRVGSELLAAVDAACRMAAATDGLYDPTVGAAVISAGYDRSFEKIVADGPGQDSGRRPGGAWRLVGVDRAASTMTVPYGFQLDLGGSAKGWAVDTFIRGEAASILVGLAGAGVCVSAGGDLAVTGIPPLGGWPVAIQERLDGGGSAPGRDVRLRAGAMATSGATYRQWLRDGVSGHHIIDPRTGEPGSSRWILVTTFADSCLVADTMATAAWLLDDAAPERLESWGIGARLVDDTGAEVMVGDPGRWLAPDRA
jgi:thiamine biosynthesis lipoprotein